MSFYTEVEYSEISPSGLVWSSGKNKGSSAGWRKKKDGYWTISVKRKFFMCHRVVYSLYFPFMDIINLQIDHIDGNKDNNKIENLRAISPRHNTQNKTKYKNNKSGISCVRRENVQRDKKDTVHGYWRVYWKNAQGKRFSKAFSVEKLGENKAFIAARSFRENILLQMNTENCYYTARHGQ